MISYHDILDAHDRIKDLIVKTPLLTSDRLNDKLGYRLFIKAEPLQRTGAFKFRGACNALLSLPPEAGAIIAYSSGNHAQAVALVARLTGRRATIIMPQDSPKAKIEGTKSYGAEVVLYDRYRENREEIGDALTAERNAVLVKPYDNEAVICGQGTAGLEMAEQFKAQTITPERVLCCAGGGGLISGIAVALSHAFPDVPVISAEPEGFDDVARSLSAGEICYNDTSARSICDAIITPAPGEITFPIMKAHLAGGVSVSDEEALRAVQTCWRHLKLVVEPGGAVAVAAALALKQSAPDIQGRDVVAVASGGNCDEDMFERALGLKGAL